MTTLPDPATPPWLLTALDLHGRRVLVAGAGSVATRRLERYLAAGARVEVVAPRASDEVRRLAAAGRLVWHDRAVAGEDVEGAWFVLAATDDPDANRLVAEAAEAAHTFCVRADHAGGGSARTPTWLAGDGYAVAIIGHRNPRGSRELRRRIARALGWPLPG